MRFYLTFHRGTGLTKYLNVFIGEDGIFSGEGLDLEFPLAGSAIFQPLWGPGALHPHQCSPHSSQIHVLLVVKAEPYYQLKGI